MMKKTLVLRKSTSIYLLAGAPVCIGNADATHSVKTKLTFGGISKYQTQSKLTTMTRSLSRSELEKSYVTKSWQKLLLLCVL